MSFLHLHDACDHLYLITPSHTPTSYLVKVSLLKTFSRWFRSKCNQMNLPGTPDLCRTRCVIMLQPKVSTNQCYWRCALSFGMIWAMLISLLTDSVHSIHCITNTRRELLHHLSAVRDTLVSFMFGANSTISSDSRSHVKLCFWSMWYNVVVC